MSDEGENKKEDRFDIEHGFIHLADPFDSLSWTQFDNVCPETSVDQLTATDSHTILKIGKKGMYRVYKTTKHDMLRHFAQLRNAPKFENETFVEEDWVVKDYVVMNENNPDDLACISVRSQLLASFVNSELESFSHIDDNGEKHVYYLHRLCENICGIYYFWRCIQMDPFTGYRRIILYSAMPQASTTLKNYIATHAREIVEVQGASEEQNKATALKRKHFCYHTTSILFQAIMGLRAIQSGLLQMVHGDLHDENVFLITPDSSFYDKYSQLWIYKVNVASTRASIVSKAEEKTETYIVPMTMVGTPIALLADFDRVLSSRIAHLTPQFTFKRAMESNEYYQEVEGVMPRYYDMVRLGSTVRTTLFHTLESIPNRVDKTYQEITDLDRFLGEMTGGFFESSYNGFILQKIKHVKKDPSIKQKEMEMAQMPHSSIDWNDNNARNVANLNPESFLTQNTSVFIQQWKNNKRMIRKDQTTSEFEPMPLFHDTNNSIMTPAWTRERLRFSPDDLVHGTVASFLVASPSRDPESFSKISPPFPTKISSFPTKRSPLFATTSPLFYPSPFPSAYPPSHVPTFPRTLVTRPKISQSPHQRSTVSRERENNQATQVDTNARTQVL